MSETFEAMSLDEQEVWWLNQAKSVLSILNLPHASIEWLAYTHNAVFDVRYEQEHYVLRLSLAENAVQIDSERHILDTLSQEGLNVPKPVKVIQTDTVSGLLLMYMQGISPTADDVSLTQMALIGKFLAQLHQIKFDSTLTRHALNWDGLFSEQGIYQPSDDNMRVFTGEQLSVMKQVAESVQLAMASLGQSEEEFGIIHGDFLLKNILFHNKTVHALDFEYCGWGYYLYDLTPILWQLKPQGCYPQLEQALWDGYASIRLLTQRHRDLLETLIAGRQVASMRWIASNQDNPYVAGKVEAILAQRTAELSAFLETGILKRA